MPRTSTFTRLSTFVPFDYLLLLLSENRPRFCVTVVNDSTKCISFEKYFPFCLSFETFVSNTVSLRPRLDVNGVYSFDLFYNREIVHCDLKRLLCRDSTVYSSRLYISSIYYFIAFIACYVKGPLSLVIE